jgi:hypothetical protein
MTNVFLVDTRLRQKATQRTVGCRRQSIETYTRPCKAQPPLQLPSLETQFIVVLKGIGEDTYECLKNNPNETDGSEFNQLQNRTRGCLKELMRARAEYVDTTEKGLLIAGMQNIPLVYGDTMLGSAKWEERRPEMERVWVVERSGDESMDIC